jgi:hypothetical protein
MVTGLPGYSCSRLFNVVLSLTLTVHLLDPFRHLNFPRWKIITVVLAGILALLHISDMVCITAADMRYIREVTDEPYVGIILGFHLPGLATVATIYCTPSDGVVDDSHCNTANLSVTSGFLIAVFLLYYVVPPLLVLVCMIIQVTYLRKGLCESSPSLNSASRHASTTILMSSLLFFLCHITFLVLVLYWTFYIGFVNQDPKKIPSLSHQGNIVGATEFILPLVYAVLYPIILIARKPELRQRYINFYGRLRSCFRTGEDTPVNQ